MNVRETVEASKVLLDSRISALGGGDEAIATAYREKIQEMAQNGCLDLLGRLLRFHCEGYGGDVLNTDLPIEECALSRGGLIALRGYWKELMDLGADADHPQVEQPTTEMNPFAEIPGA